MNAIKTVHECLFCLQTFDTATAKDEHVLEHFAQETCMDCDRNLIRIGGILYTKHEPTTCIKRVVKVEVNVEPSLFTIESTQNHAELIPNEPECVGDVLQLLKGEAVIKVEQLDPIDDSNSESLPIAETEISPISNEEDEMVFKEEIQMEGNPTNFSHEGFSIDKISQKVKCETCGKLLGSKRSFRKHTILLHSPPGTIFCRFCARLFDDIAECDIHKTECAWKKKMRRQNAKQQPRKNRAEKSGERNKPIVEQKIKCETCGKYLTGIRSFRKHKILQHSPPGTNFCHICARLFDDIIECNEHRTECTLKKQIWRKRSKPKLTEMKQIDDENSNETKESEEIKCKVCSTKLKTNANLRKHMTMCHSTIEKFKCPQCSVVFLKESSLEAHICPKNRAYPCDLCDKVLSSPKLFRLHQVHKHNVHEIICCDVCGKEFSEISERDKHREDCALKKSIRTLEARGQFECDICKKVYSTKGDLSRHMRSIHAAKGNRFSCRSCGFVCVKEATLKKHSCEAVGEGERTNERKIRRDKNLIPCDVCGKVIARGSLRSHRIALHSAPGTIFCRTCLRLFSTQEDLDEHQQHCKSKTKKEECPCDVCGRVLSSRGTLKKHKAAAHSDPSSLICRTCYKPFANAEILGAHRLQCAVKKCNICGKVLANAGVLRRHKIALHTSGIIFCKTCCKQFKTVEELNDHIPECNLKRKLRKLRKRNQAIENKIE